jgi:hypothetical protein
MDIIDIKIGNEAININSKTNISWEITEDDIEIMMGNPENYILIKDNNLNKTQNEKNN